MTNVEGAAGEGAKLSRAYTDAMKKEPLVFKIPVFNNMPETACAKPTVTGSPNNKLSGITIDGYSLTTGSPNNKLASLEVEGYSLTPTFNKDTESYDVIVNPSVGQISVKAGTIDSKASVSGTGTISLQSGNNTISIEVKAENGSVRTYRLNVVRQSDAPVANVPSGGENAQSSGGNTSGPGSTGNVVIIRPSGQGNSPESQSADVVIGVSPS